MPVKKAKQTASAPAVTEDGANGITVKGDGFEAEFWDANLVSLVYDGKEVLKSAPQPEGYRAPVDNDKWIWEKKDGRVVKSAKIECDASHDKLEWEVVEDKIVVRTEKEYTMDGGIQAIVHTTWDIARDGAITVTATVNCGNSADFTLYRNGFAWVLDGAYTRVSYLGYGPHENYRDRRHAAWFDRFNTTVEGMIEPYVKSQSYGNRIGTRNVILFGEDEDLPALSFTVLANIPGSGDARVLSGAEFSVSPWSDQEISESYTRDRLPVPGAKTVLHLDSLVSGLGGASCGPEPLPQYKVGNPVFNLRYVLAPYKGKLNQK